MTSMIATLSIERSNIEVRERERGRESRQQK